MAKRERIVTAGRMVYCVSYTIPKYLKEDTPRQRGQKRRESGAWKARLNRLRSCEKLEQLIYCNFGSGDRYVTLTYRDECLPSTRQEVMKDFKYFRRKLALRRKARGQTCPYVYVIEHKTSKGRWHIHAILSGTGAEDERDIRECWSKGLANVKWFDLKQGEQLAAYLAKERPDYVGEHPWMSSRGLKRPVVTSSVVPDASKLAVPPGAVIRARDTRQNQYGEFEYIKYFRT